MDKLHATMVEACDRLLQLLTGPRALHDPSAAEAALEAIELLSDLESYLKGAAGNFVLDERVLDRLAHRSEVLNHITDVVGVLREQGLLAAEYREPLAA